jgi:hypothetical protein
MKRNFIYYTENKRYLISDLDFCARSERTIDLPFNTLATNEELLDKLNLVSNFTDKPNGAKWFASYIAAFENPKKDSEIYNKLLTNPMIRLLLIDEELFKSIQTIKL